MGFSVQLFETVAWAEELLPAATAADVPRLPRLYTAAGYACFVGRAEAAAANAHRATELEADARYDPCEPGYATFIEALGQVYCGHLDRYVELTGTVAALPGVTSRLRHRGVPRRSAVGRSGRRGARIDRLGGRRGPRAGQPVLDRLHAVDRRAGLLQGRRRSGHCWPGTRASRSSASTGSSSSRASSDATRRACTPPKARPRPRWHCSDRPSSRSTRRATWRSSSSRWPACLRSSNASAASMPRRRCSGPSHASRPASTTSPSSSTSASASPRSSARRERGSSRPPAPSSISTTPPSTRGSRSSSLAGRSSARHAMRVPAGLTRREVDVLRLIAEGQTTREIADAAVHLVEDRRQPHPAHLHEARRHQPRRSDPLGHRTPARRRRLRRLISRPPHTVSRRNGEVSSCAAAVANAGSIARRPTGLAPDTRPTRLGEQQ